MDVQESRQTQHYCVICYENGHNRGDSPNLALCFRCIRDVDDLHGHSDNTTGGATDEDSTQIYELEGKFSVLFPAHAIDKNVYELEGSPGQFWERDIYKSRPLGKDVTAE
jgi:hypothetical protein